MIHVYYWYTNSMWMFLACFLWICFADYFSLSSATNTTISPATTTSSYVVGVAVTVSIVAICLAFICIIIIATIVGYLYKKRVHILLARLKENGGAGIRNAAYQPDNHPGSFDEETSAKIST